MLPDRKGLARVGVTRPDDGHDARDEKHNIKDEIDRGLSARLQKAVEDVSTHMTILGKCVGPRHHEEGAIEHDLHIKSPGMRAIEHIACEDLVAD